MAYNIPPITNALGKPVVEQKQEFFVVFEGINGTEPEVVDKSSYKITYIVDSQGNISKPAEGAASSFNILQNFNSGEPVTVVLDQATSENSTLGGTHIIDSIGKPVPYIYSQNGIGSESYESRLLFRPQGAPPSGSYSPLDKYNSAWASNEYYEDDYANNMTTVPQFYGDYTYAPPYGVISRTLQSTQGYFRGTGYPDWDNLYTYPSEEAVYLPTFTNAEFLAPFGIEAGEQDEFVLTWAIPNTDQFPSMDIPPYYPDPSENRFTITNTPESGIASITASDGFLTVDFKNSALQSIDMTVFLKGKSKKYYPAGDSVYSFFPTKFCAGSGPDLALYWQTAVSGSTDYENDYATYPFDSCTLGGLLIFPVYNNLYNIYNNTGFIRTLPASFYVDPYDQIDFEATWKVTIPANKIVEGRAIRILMGGNLRGVELGDSLTIETANISFTNQVPQPDDYFVENDIYWERNGPTNARGIRSSTRLAEFYDQFYLPTPAQENFGFDKVSTPFNIKVGDRIRFQYNPKQEFTIYTVITPAQGGGRIKLILDRDIPAYLDGNMSNFVIYRIDDSLANNIVLDVKKANVLGDPENPFTGIILPQYPSDGIVANSDKILEQLKADGIIKS